ncbi:conserved hypothetical protein [Streptomyces sp. SPB78]|nr:conserved hypothetical protein [Streptomyces sp. SPB78]
MTTVGASRWGSEHDVKQQISGTSKTIRAVETHVSLDPYRTITDRHGQPLVRLSP